MSTPLEKHLEFHCEQLEKKIEQLEFELATAEQCIADYKILSSHLRTQVSNMLDNAHFNRPIIKMSAV